MATNVQSEGVPSDCGADHANCGAHGDSNTLCFDTTCCFCSAGNACGGEQDPASTCTPGNLTPSVCIPVTETLTTLRLGECRRSNFRQRGPL